MTPSASTAPATPAAPAVDDVYLDQLRSRCAGGWRLTVDPGGFWVHAVPDGVTVPAQGWKLHVTAGLSSAVEVLTAALEVLVAERTTFKVARSPAHLDALNWGASGHSQVGKFLTVYPVDDAEAVAIAHALDDATAGGRGPRVPSDRPLRPGSLVHYRYGSFAHQYAQLPSGAVAAIVTTPDGGVTEDTRRLDPPAWVQDPFVAVRPSATADPPRSTVLAGRFALLSTMVASPRGAVFLAVDLDGPRRCVVKHARRDAQLTAHGRDARDRLRAEAAALEQLGSGPWPAFLALVDEGDDVFLAEEEIVGERLSQRLAVLAARGRHVDEPTLRRWGAALAEALATIQARGLVVRDLKASNVIVTADGELRMIDLECAPLGAALAPGETALATRGSASPQQRAGDAPQAADDVFGLAALLWFVASGADPAGAPDPTALVDRPLATMRPGLEPTLAAAIERGLAPAVADRWASAAAFGQALTATAAATGTPARAAAGPPPPSVGADRWAHIAGAIGRTLAARAVPSPTGGLAWKRPNGPVVVDLASGDAGIVLALSALVRSGHGHPDLPDVVAAGAIALRTAPRLADPPLPGLFIGEAGVSAALLAAGATLGDDDLTAAAVALGAQVASSPFGLPDLIGGTAGRVRAHLWLHAATGDSGALAAAQAAATQLVATAEPGWTIPDGHGSLSGKRHLGYAHGAAGIADVLLDLFEVDGDERWRDAAAATVRWLEPQAGPALDDDSGRTWPNVDDEPAAMIAWCNGSIGVATFLRHAREHALGDLDLDLTGATRAAALGTRHLGPEQCHGLAGAIEHLLDEGDPAAHDLAELLLAFVSPASLADDPAAHPGRLPADPMAARLVLGSGYLEGLAGILAVTLRLAEPTLPNLVGSRWWPLRR